MCEHPTGTFSLGQLPSSSPYTLADDVTDGQRWNLAKAEAVVVATSFQRDLSPEIQRKGERMAGCGHRLIYAYDPLKDGRGYRRTLAEARLCRVRTCPICAWRRAEKLAAEVGQVVHRLCGPGGLVPMMLTLTVRNVDVSILHDELGRMLHGWSKLRKRQYFVRLVKHWTRSIEITRGRGHIRGDSHPHIHCILMAEPEAAGLLLGVNWAKEWADVMSLDYVPQCHIMPLEGAICEALKYTVKPHDLTRHAISGWLARVEEALSGVRVFAASNKLRLKDVAADDATETEKAVHNEVDELPHGIPVGRKNIPVTVCYNWTGRAYIRGAVTIGQGAADIRAQQIALARAARARVAPPRGRPTDSASHFF